MSADVIIYVFSGLAIALAAIWALTYSRTDDTPSNTARPRDHARRQPKHGDP